MRRHFSETFEDLSAFFRTSFGLTSEIGVVESGPVAVAVPRDVDRARRILARGRSAARSLGLTWMAVRVERRRRFSIRRRSLSALSDLAGALGGTFECVYAHDVASALIDFAKREHSPILVVGQPRRFAVLRWLRPGIAEQILSAKRPFDVLIAGEVAER